MKYVLYVGGGIVVLVVGYMGYKALTRHAPAPAPTPNYPYAPGYTPGFPQPSPPAAQVAQQIAQPPTGAAYIQAVGSGLGSLLTGVSDVIGALA